MRAPITLRELLSLGILMALVLTSSAVGKEEFEKRKKAVPGHDNPLEPAAPAKGREPSPTASAQSVKTICPNGVITVEFKKRSDAAPYRVSVRAKGDGERFAFESGITLGQDSFVWNEAGNALAFSAGTPFLMNCYILFIAEDRWTVVKAPGPQPGWDNFHQVPKKWNGDKLHLEVDGPYAGKARGNRFSGSMEVEISAARAKTRIVSEEINGGDSEPVPIEEK